MGFSKKLTEDRELWPSLWLVAPPTRIHRSATDWGGNTVHFRCLYLDARRATLRNSVEEDVFRLLNVHRKRFWIVHVIHIVHTGTVHMAITYVERAVRSLNHHHVISLRPPIGSWFMSLKFIFRPIKFQMDLDLSHLIFIYCAVISRSNYWHRNWVRSLSRLKLLAAKNRKSVTRNVSGPFTLSENGSESENFEIWCLSFVLWSFLLFSFPLPRWRHVNRPLRFRSPHKFMMFVDYHLACSNFSKYFFCSSILIYNTLPELELILETFDSTKQESGRWGRPRRAASGCSSTIGQSAAPSYHHKHWR